MRIDFSLHRPFGVSIVLAVATALISGCAAIPTKLPPEARAKVTANDVRCFMPQETVDVQYMKSGYGAGLGLIGAIVDAGVNASLAGSAAERAAKIREAVKHYDFRGKYWSSISNTVATTSWLQMHNFTVFPSNYVPVKAEMVVERGVFNLGTDHYLTPDHRVLGVKMGVSLFLPKEHKKASASNMLLYHSRRMTKDEGNKAMNNWIADGAAVYKQAAEHATRESARLLSHALNHMYGITNGTVRPAKVKADFTHGRGGFGIPTGRVSIKGVILEELPDRIVFQAPPGNLFSLPREDIEVTYKKK